MALGQHRVWQAPALPVAAHSVSDLSVRGIFRFESLSEKAQQRWSLRGGSTLIQVVVSSEARVVS